MNKDDNFKKIHDKINREAFEKYYTPKWLSKLIYEKAVIERDDVKRERNLSVADFTCGCGSLLEPFYNDIDTFFNIYGFDIDGEAINYCKDKFVLKSKFENKDFLTSKIDKKFDIVVLNPPFGTKQVEDDWEWFDKAFEKLNTDGIMIFIGSSNMLTSNTGKKYRKYYHENIKEVIKMPEKMFTWTAISVVIFVVSKYPNKEYFIVKEFGGIVGKHKLTPFFTDPKNKKLNILRDKYKDYFKKSCYGLTNNSFCETVFTYDTSFTRFEENNYSLLPNQYIKFIDWEFVDIDFDFSIKNEIKQIRKLEIEEKENKKKLELFMKKLE